MRFYKQFLIFLLFAAFSFACNSTPSKQLTPLETLKAYGNAYKKKDITAMKLLLSEESLKMHEQEAKAQNVTVDDIVKRETLFSENQTTAEFRNEKTEDAQASVEMKDSLGIWNTVHFVKEDGAWKIDRKSEAQQIEQTVEQKNNELDQLINQGRIDDNTNANSGAGGANTTNVNANVNTAVNANIDANPSGDTNANVGAEMPQLRQRRNAPRLVPNN